MPTRPCAKAAVRYERANAKRHGVDADKIAMFGESAGACSAMAVAMTFESDYKADVSTDDDPTLSTTNPSESSRVATVRDHWSSDDLATQLTSRDGRPRHAKANAPVAAFHGIVDNLVCPSQTRFRSTPGTTPAGCDTGSSR